MTNQEIKSKVNELYMKADCEYEEALEEVMKMIDEKENNIITDMEKNVLVMLLKMEHIILNTQGGDMLINGEYFTENDLYNLCKKLGIDYDSVI